MDRKGCKGEAPENALPFAVELPNEATEAAMAEARRGGLASYDSVNAFLASLNAQLRGEGRRP